MGIMLLTAAPSPVQAQCSMCTASVTSHAQDGESEVAEGLNTGIIYLFVLPYLSFMAVAFFIYRGYRKRQRRALVDQMVLDQTDLPSELNPNQPDKDV